MTLVPADQHVYFILAAYAVAALGLGGLMSASWLRARRIVRQAEAGRQGRHSDDT
jgi:putative component of membrane protein insertase Oxa1/YidC/SpoIIIJ protein YidD